MRQTSAVFAVVITGPPGAGKTAVLTALSDALSADDIPHAAIEIEALVWAHPPLAESQVLRHVHTVCDLYRDAGYELLLVAQTLESDNEVLQLLDAVRADEHMLVRLDARPATLIERITQREPASWSGLSGLLAYAQRLSRAMPLLRGVDLVIGTEGAHAEDVAARIRHARPNTLTSTSTRRP